MRLLALIPSLTRGGLEEYVLRISTAACHAGWDVHGAWPDVAALESFRRDWTDRGMTYHRVDIGVENDSPRTLTSSHHLIRFARTLRLLWTIRPRVVLVGLPWPTFALGPLLACAVLRIPTLASFQLAPWPMTIVGKTLSAYQWARSRRQVWLTNSADCQRNLSESFHISANAIRIVRNGVKISLFGKPLTVEERLHTRTSLLQEFGIAPGTRLLVTVARLHIQKGYGDLLLAADAIAKEFSDVRFVWVGDGDLRRELEHGIRERGLDDRVILTGFRPDLARFYTSADLFIFPTHFEGGASFALVEAMAAGAPVVSSNASGIPEVIENGVHGLLYEAKNARALTETIRYALNHPAELEIMARNARARAAEMSEERMCRDTLKVLAELAYSRVAWSAS